MRAIVTVLGKDKSGIIAKVSNVLADNDVNIEDISQTIVQGNFTMLMLCDLEKAKLTLQQLKTTLEQVGEQIGVVIHIQNEEIFNAMHKV